LSQTDAFANVKQFLIDKIKTLENNVQRLQSQTDNDQQIINFLDDSIKVKEREQNEWMIERDAYTTEKLKWNETSHLVDLKERELSKTIDQLKSQKKVLVNEVKRMRREKKEYSRG
jgi:chromosome segregation ATPase